MASVSKLSKRYQEPQSKLHIFGAHPYPKNAKYNGGQAHMQEQPSFIRWIHNTSLVDRVYVSLFMLMTKKKQKIVYTLVKIYVCWLFYSYIDSQNNSCFKLCHKNDYINCVPQGENDNFILNISRYVQFIPDLYGRAKTYMNFQKV